MKVKIKKKPDKAKDILKKIESAFSKDPGVLVGLPKDSQPYPDGTPVQMVGLVHEFGSEKINMPERSFLRSTVSENKRAYLAFMKKLAKKVSRGEISGEDAMSLLGLKVVSDVKAKIVEIREPANTAGTIARKGSSNPLIDSAHMQNSITWMTKADAN